MAMDAGADALGLVGEMPSGPGIIDDHLVRDIVSAVRASVETFLLTARETGEEIVEHAQYCGPNVVQIVRHIEPTEYPFIIKHLPAVTRVQVIHIEGDRSLDLIDTYSPFVDAFLLDSGRPGADTVELGGTGRVHDWNISSQFVRRSQKPVFLAGGLNSGNVVNAIRTVGPYGLDLCSSVRTNGRLDGEKLNHFMQVVRTNYGIDH